MKTEKIAHENQIIAMVFYMEDIEPGIHFYTPDDSMLQVGKHLRRKGEVIKAHKHLPVKFDKTENLQEVLYIESGKMKVNFYTDNGNPITSKVLNAGDMVLLVSGGHSFEFIEETKMIEVKQGPYNPDSRKVLDIKEEK